MPTDNQSVQLFVDIASFIFDRWEFVLGLFFGSAGTYITNKIRISKKNRGEIDQGSKSQSSMPIDSPNSSPQASGRDSNQGDGIATISNSPGASIVLGHSSGLGKPEDALGSNIVPFGATPSIGSERLYISNRVQEIILKFNLDSTSAFPARYQNSITHLKNDAFTVCAAEYHTAFLPVVPILLESDTYGENQPPKKAIGSLNDSFQKIKKFLCSSSHDGVDLRNTINSFETTMVILLSHIT